MCVCIYIGICIANIHYWYILYVRGNLVSCLSHQTNINENWEGVCVCLCWHVCAIWERYFMRKLQLPDLISTVKGFFF